MGGRLHKGKEPHPRQVEQFRANYSEWHATQNSSPFSNFTLVGLKSLELERETIDKERLLHVQFEEALRKDVHPDTTSFMESGSQKAHTF